MRTCGILLPIFSLPSRYGIGCFSAEAYEFIDFLSESGQTYWQILPLVPAGDCESPYSSPSTFAGNPLFIDLEQLRIQRLLTKDEIDNCNWGNSFMINYPLVKENKMRLLYKAFERSDHYKDPNFISFCKENEYWLDDYAQYMERKERKSVDYYIFEQFVFDEQWKRLRQHAKNKGIQIIGDLPIYVSLNSVDVDSKPELFDLDHNGKPSSVAGCPPDMSSTDGQVWGNPLYDWTYHKQTGYTWWVERIKRCMRLYDIVRLDHFRGFYDYYTVPVGKTAKEGEWKLGPGLELFKVLEEKVPNLKVIVEDLGILSPGVHQLMKDTGYPGMKILHFAFNSGKDNPYLPENIHENFVVYTGTHDNNTTMGWFDEATDWEKRHFYQYIQHPCGCVSWDMLELAMSTRADTCIIQMQDYLVLGSDCRINTPGTININWKWRMLEQPSRDLLESIKRMTYKYHRERK